MTRGRHHGSHQQDCRKRWRFPIWMLLVVMIMSSSSLVQQVDAQEKAFFQTPQFTSENVTHRNNVCDRFKDFLSGKVLLRDSLRGLQLSVLIRPSDQVWLEDDGSIVVESPGIIVVLLDELGRRAGFTWRNSFGVTYGLDANDHNHTWSDLLAWGVRTYDVFADQVSHSSQRLQQGAAFPHGYFDSSVIMVGRKLAPVDQLDLWNWVQPYDSMVWVMIVITVVYSALVYQFLEWCGDEQDDRSLLTWFGDNLYLSSLLFTQNFEYGPKSNAARLFSVSMALWALLMSTTYTANLANFFVQSKQSPRKITTVAEAVNARRTFCAMKGTFFEDYMVGKYGHAPGFHLITYPTHAQVFLAVTYDECDIAITGADDWELASRERSSNPFCALEWFGEVDATVPAGFAASVDTGTYCSSLVRDVINLHMVEMEHDDYLSNAWDDQFDFVADLDCSNVASLSVASTEQEADTTSNTQSQRKIGKAAIQSAEGEAIPLHLRNLAGSFCLHFLLSFAAVSLAIFGYILRKYEEQNPKFKERRLLVMSSVHGFASRRMSFTSQRSNNDDTIFELSQRSGVVDDRSERSESVRSSRFSRFSRFSNNNTTTAASRNSVISELSERSNGRNLSRLSEIHEVDELQDEDDRSRGTSGNWDSVDGMDNINETEMYISDELYSMNVRQNAMRNDLLNKMNRLATVVATLHQHLEEQKKEL